MGSMTTSEILKYSSNIGAVKIAGALGGTKPFDKWIHRFGFGKATGVDLPGEEIGQVLPLEKYSGATMGNLPIGQGISVTPMQMMAAYAAIANGGILRPPHIVDTVGGRPTEAPAGKRVISEATAASVRKMLEGVLGTGGTASGAEIPGYTTAGKTGTAEKAINGEYSKEFYVASFVGFAPAKQPEAARRGDRRRAQGRHLRRPGRGAGVEADRQLRARLQEDRARAGLAGLRPSS